MTIIMHPLQDADNMVCRTTTEQDYFETDYSPLTILLETLD